MKRILVPFGMGLLLLAAGIAAEKKIQLKDLPPAAQKSVQDLLKGAELKDLSQEEEKGKTVYEVETVKNGKTRDAIVDAAGTILEVEEGVTLNEIPAPAKAAIEKAAIGGEILKVEAIIKNGVTNYEAAIAKKGKNSEITVTAAGLIVK
jgi:uncharacterized membrane protein YkoI